MPPDMPRVVLMCGPAGSGKSGYAARLEDQGYLRLSIDEAAWRQGHREHPLPEEVSAPIVTAQREQLVEAVTHGRDVVVDYAFWSRQQRDDYRAVATEAGASVEVVFLRVAATELRRRILARNAGPVGPSAIRVEPDLLTAYIEWFEVPGPGEPDVTVIDG